MAILVLAVAVSVLTIAILSQLANAEGDVLENLELIENLEVRLGLGLESRGLEAQL